MELDPNVLSAQQQMLTDFAAAKSAMADDATKTQALLDAQRAKDATAASVAAAKQQAAKSLAAFEAALASTYTIA